MNRRGSHVGRSALRTKAGRAKLKKFSINLNPEIVQKLENKGFTVQDLIEDFLEFLKNLEVENSKKN